MADFAVIFMDAGQGDCTLIEYPDGSLTLVDCGSTKSGAQAFVEIKKVIDQKFQNNQEGFSLVLTHPDEDHYNLLKYLKIEEYWDSNKCPFFIYYGGGITLYKNKKDKNYTYDLLSWLENDHSLASPPETSTSVKPDPILSRAGVNVTILAANCTGMPNSKTGKNANSIVLLVEYEGAKIFLMGDAFIQTETFIINSFKGAGQLNRLGKQPGEHVVLKMGHHGSDTSSDPAWIKLITPDVLVVSSGTKFFSGKGMPTSSHLQSTVNNTTLTTTGINQSYVVFNEAKQGHLGQDFVTMPQTQQAIWTTCYEVQWEPTNARWFESGQTWYYGVEKNGKKIAHHWYGYTGY